jgi:hypothetical protein
MPTISMFSTPCFGSMVASTLQFFFVGHLIGTALALPRIVLR